MIDTARIVFSRRSGEKSNMDAFVDSRSKTRRVLLGHAALLICRRDRQQPKPNCETAMPPPTFVSTSPFPSCLLR
jgi:hypothetical protein